MKLHIIIMVLPSVYRFRLCSCTYTHSLIVPFCPSLKSLTSDLSRMVFSFQIVHSTLSGLILPKHALLMILFSLLVLVLLLQVIWTLLAYPYKTFPMASLLPAVILFFPPHRGYPLPTCFSVVQTYLETNESVHIPQKWSSYWIEYTI